MANLTFNCPRRNPSPPEIFLQKITLRSSNSRFDDSTQLLLEHSANELREKRRFLIGSKSLTAKNIKLAMPCALIVSESCRSESLLMLTIRNGLWRSSSVVERLHLRLWLVESLESLKTRNQSTRAIECSKLERSCFVKHPQAQQWHWKFQHWVSLTLLSNTNKYRNIFFDNFHTQSQQQWQQWQWLEFY